MSFVWRLFKKANDYNSAFFGDKRSSMGELANAEL